MTAAMEKDVLALSACIASAGAPRVAVPSARAGVLAQEVLRTDAVPAAPSAGAVLCAMHSLVQKEPSIRRVLGVFSGAQAVE